MGVNGKAQVREVAGGEAGLSATAAKCAASGRDDDFFFGVGAGEKIRAPSPWRVLAWPPLVRVSVTGLAPSGGQELECCHWLEPMVKYWTLGVFSRKPVSSPFRK